MISKLIWYTFRLLKSNRQNSINCLHSLVTINKLWFPWMLILLIIHRLILSICKCGSRLLNWTAIHLFWQCKILSVDKVTGFHSHHIMYFNLNEKVKIILVAYQVGGIVLLKFNSRGSMRERELLRRLWGKLLYGNCQVNNGGNILRNFIKIVYKRLQIYSKTQPNYKPVQQTPWSYQA